MDSLICKHGCGRIVPRQHGESDKKYRTRKFCSERCQRDFQSAKQRASYKKISMMEKKRSFTDVDMEKVYKSIERMPAAHEPVRFKFDGNTAELLRQSELRGHGRKSKARVKP